MAKKSSRSRGRKDSTSNVAAQATISADADTLLMAALARGDDPSKTGRYLVTFKEGASDAAVKQLQASSGLRMAHARDFNAQAVVLEEAGDADAIVLPEINVALVSGPAAAERSLARSLSVASDDDPFQSVDPEYFVFATATNPADYMKGVLQTAQMIARELGLDEARLAEPDVTAEVLGATWGLSACRVPQSSRDGNGIKVAVLDTGFDLGHPEFAGRTITAGSFVGQPPQDMHGHGTHCVGTSAGPSAPPGTVQRYGIACRSHIFVGKVLNNSGNGTQMQSLAGINWAVANRCAVISMSLGAKAPAQPAYTAAGQAALNAGCLIVAAAGNSGPGPTEAPGNSPTIMAVAAVDINLQPAPFSCRGKIDIAGPGVNVFSSWIRPLVHNTISGTSMATPHVAGCAALWAQSSSLLRGAALRDKLLATAKRLPFASTIVGRGLVQAP